MQNPITKFPCYSYYYYSYYYFFHTNFKKDTKPALLSNLQHHLDLAN